MVSYGAREAINAHTNQWIRIFVPKHNAQLRLFCFPYAGGGASIYRDWAKALPPEVEVCSIQLPGREGRLRETPIRQISTLIQELVHVIHPYLDRPFAFWGHSMGAIIAFELTRQLRKEGMPGPSHLFVSGRSAPQIPNLRAAIHQLPDLEFMEEMRRLNGTPEAVLQNGELMELLLPILRADFALVETYTYVHEAPLECPISAFGGLQDNLVSSGDLEAWNIQTWQNFKMRMFDGDHFFLHSLKCQLTRNIFQDLSIMNPNIWTINMP